VLFVVFAVQGFGQVSEHDLFVFAQLEEGSEDGPEAFAVLVVGDGGGKSVHSDKGTHISHFHQGLQEVFDTEVQGNFLFGKAVEGEFGWDVGRFGRIRKGFLVLRVSKGLEVGVLIDIIYLLCAIEILLLFVRVLDLRENIATILLLHHRCLALTLILQIQHSPSGNKGTFSLLSKLDIGLLNRIIAVLQEISAFV
jgi:hypothetical protein